MHRVLLLSWSAKRIHFYIYCFQTRDVESTAEEVDKSKSEEVTTNAEEETRSENGESVENGETEKENGKEHVEKVNEEDETGANLLIFLSLLTLSFIMLIFTYNYILRINV